MKKKRVLITVLLTAVILTAGCGTQSTPAPQPAESEAVEAVSPATEAQKADAQPEMEAIEEAGTEETASAEYEDPSGLPTYTYTGTEDYLDVISEYMVTEYAKKYPEQVSVFIPYSIVVETDDSNPDDILVYGEYALYGYDLRNTTLIRICGARNGGIFHLQKADDGTVTVVKAELPETDDETEKLFSSARNAYDKIKSLTDEDFTEARATAIAEYVNTNGLHIDQWQDALQPPVVVLNAPEPKETDEFYTFESPKGYSLTYDLREILLDEKMDIYGKIDEDNPNTGTFLVVEKWTSADPETVLKDEMKKFNVTDAEITDATIGNDLACITTQFQLDQDNGESYYYIGYAIPMGDDTLCVWLETIYQEGVNEMTMDDLAQLFAPMLKSFHLN